MDDIISKKEVIGIINTMILHTKEMIDFSIDNMIKSEFGSEDYFNAKKILDNYTGDKIILNRVLDRIEEIQ